MAGTGSRARGDAVYHAAKRAVQWLSWQQVCQRKAESAAWVNMEDAWHAVKRAGYDVGTTQAKVGLRLKLLAEDGLIERMGGTMNNYPPDRYSKFRMPAAAAHGQKLEQKDINSRAKVEAEFIAISQKVPFVKDWKIAFNHSAQVKVLFGDHYRGVPMYEALAVMKLALRASDDLVNSAQNKVSVMPRLTVEELDYIIGSLTGCGFQNMEFKGFSGADIMTKLLQMYDVTREEGGN